MCKAYVLLSKITKKSFISVEFKQGFVKAISRADNYKRVHQENIDCTCMSKEFLTKCEILPPSTFASLLTVI